MRIDHCIKIRSKKINIHSVRPDINFRMVNNCKIILKIRTKFAADRSALCPMLSANYY
jgi:hypothetical protein